MRERDTKRLSENLGEAREKLTETNKRVREHIRSKQIPHETIDTKSHRATRLPSKISINRIHKRLSAINDYLKERACMDTEKISYAPPCVKETPHEISRVIPSVIRPTVTRRAGGRPGIGLDLGTSYIVAAREKNDRAVIAKSERNACLMVKYNAVTEKLLTKLKIKYMTMGDRVYILSNSALDLANIFSRELQRPMSQGILNPSESESIPIIKMLIENIVWTPRERSEICCFSIPSPPIDRNQDTIYHRSVFESILTELGFKPVVIEEGYAVVLAELGSKDFTGIGISCGGGLVNICATFRSIPAISFSISRGGDWIDQSAASVLGVPSSKVTAVKEEGIDLKRPRNREEEAIAIYYRNYIRYFLENIAYVFSHNSNAPEFKEPVDIVLAGGSSMAGNFLNVVKDEITSLEMGFKVGDISRAEDPFATVSRGCLFNAITVGTKTGDMN
jgi:hypothetical protein